MEPSARGLAFVNFTVRRASQYFLPQLRWFVFPVFGNAPLLDRLLFFPRIALPRRGDQANLDDLARHGDITRVPQHCVETVEQRLDGARRRAFFPKQPDRARVRNSIRQAKARKRMSDIRSLIRNSARTSDRLSIA